MSTHTQTTGPQNVSDAFPYSDALSLNYHSFGACTMFFFCTDNVFPKTRTQASDVMTLVLPVVFCFLLLSYLSQDRNIPSRPCSRDQHFI